MGRADHPEQGSVIKCLLSHLPGTQFLAQQQLAYLSGDESNFFTGLL
jgi:hypothetical protein